MPDSSVLKVDVSAMVDDVLRAECTRLYEENQKLRAIINEIAADESAWCNCWWYARKELAQIDGEH